MKAKRCEKCGKELGFFDFKHEINHERINLHYDCLCTKCYRILNAGIESLDALYTEMIEGLRSRRKITNTAAVDLDTLIFRAVEVIFEKIPDFHKGDSKIHRALIDSGFVGGPADELRKIIEYLIDYRFAINKKNAQVIDFRDYFKRTTAFCEQVGLNRKEGIPKSYYHLFMNCRGLTAINMETAESFSMPIDENIGIVYETINETDILVSSMHYPDDSERNVMLYPVNQEQSKGILASFEHLNNMTARRREQKRRETMSRVCRNIFKDLKQIRPDEKFSQIPIDCILIFIVKNIMGEQEAKKVPFYDENSLLMDILFENFHDNLMLFGRTERSDLSEYIRKNTLFSEGFHIQYDKKQERGMGFFTSKGYILCFLESRKFIYVFDDRLPNDIYYPCNDLVYKGCRYLQLAETKDLTGSEPFQKFDGLIFFSRDIEKIGKMNRFFNLNSILYVMDRYVEAESKIFQNREILLEVKRVSDKLFGEFSFLPFCQYDEWAAILEKLKEDDFLLRQLIDQKNNGQKYSPATATVYTIRIIKAFNRCAKELENTLHFGDLSITKAILWGYFNESLIDTLSREWIRVAGDIVRDGDSLVDAFSKYFNMAEIDSNKSYYLGLYIYYLMSRGILPDDDFLENYERCIPVYQKYNQVVEDYRLKRMIEKQARPAAEPNTMRDEGLETAKKTMAEDRQTIQSAKVRSVKKDTEKPMPEPKADDFTDENTPIDVSDRQAADATDQALKSESHSQSDQTFQPELKQEPDRKSTQESHGQSVQGSAQESDPQSDHESNPEFKQTSDQELIQESNQLSVPESDQSLEEASHQHSDYELNSELNSESNSESKEASDQEPDCQSENAAEVIENEPSAPEESDDDPDEIQTIHFQKSAMKKPSEILAEKAAKAVKNEKPIRRIIENEE